jgi:uncharacterized protein YprB with RNaseH-like and TPR domain
MKKLKILFFDIETTPNLAYVWGKYQQDVVAYKKESQILSVAYKWADSSKVKCITVEKARKHSDRVLVNHLRRLFNKADILVAHNGDEFDIRRVKARLVYHNLPPTKHVPSVDTKKLAKKYFNFNSNRLNDLGLYLGLGTKVKHPGFEMWLGCLAGDKRSWGLMRKYNKQDVLLLERVYKRFLPWTQSHPNIALLQSGKLGCDKCGSLNGRKKGIRANSRGLQQQWQCNDCLGWYLTRRAK